MGMGAGTHRVQGRLQVEALAFHRAGPAHPLHRMEAAYRALRRQ